MSPPRRFAGAWGLFALVWGVGGVVLLLVQAVIRLGPRAAEPLLHGEVTPHLLVLYAISIAFNGYAEGYRAFQRQFSPRVVARALWLARNPRWPLVLLAPLFCMGHIHATRRRLILAWGVTSGLVILIAAVRMLSQPWRGIVDAGVVVGLGWGVLAIVVYLLRGLSGAPMPVPTDVPGEEEVVAAGEAPGVRGMSARP